MIKPEFFDDPDVADISLAARLCFIGLWTQADREGRLIDDQRRLKVRLFPYDNVVIGDLLAELVTKAMVESYRGEDGKAYLSIPKFTKHQRPHPKEPASVIPVPPSNNLVRHGEQCKNAAQPSESGVLILDSGTRNLEKNSAAASPPSSSPVENVRVMTRLAHDVITAEPTAGYADLKADLKTACSKHRIAYDAETAGKALESALVQRRSH